MFLLFLQRAIRFSTVFLFGSTGETLTEKSGNLNLGTPGIMCMGGAGAVLGTEAYLNMVGGAANITPFVLRRQGKSDGIYGSGGVLYAVLPDCRR